MESNGVVDRDGVNGGSWSDANNARRSRSRSPMNKNRSRDSSLDRNSRQNRNNRSHSPRDKRSRNQVTRRVYVANIPYDCKWTTLKDLFREKVGDVTYVKLFEDEDGKFRGCGIVELKDASSVPKAIEVLHRYDFNGRHLVVKEDFDVERDKTGRPVPRNRGNVNDRDRNIRSGIGGGNLANLAGGGAAVTENYGLSPQFLQSLGITGPIISRLFVANLDYKVTPQQLEDVFKLAGRVVKVDLMKDDEGKSRGYGTVEMGHPLEAVQAICMFNGQKYFNRSMSVRIDKRRKEDLEERRLPEGLQSVGKGLGANGLPLHLSYTSGTVADIAGTGLAGIGPGNLGLLQGNQMNTASVAGIPGLGGIGVGLDRSNFAGLGGQNLGLGNTPASNIGNPNLMAGGLDAMGSSSSALAGSLGSGMNYLSGGIGAGSSLGSSGGLGGYGDYDRSFDREGAYDRRDMYRQSRSSDSMLRNPRSRY